MDAVGLTCSVLEDHPWLKWHAGTEGQEWNVFVEGYECLGLCSVTHPACQEELWDELKSMQVFEDALQAETSSGAQLPTRGMQDTGIQSWAAGVRGAVVLILMDAAGNLRSNSA